MAAFSYSIPGWDPVSSKCQLNMHLLQTWLWFEACHLLKLLLDTSSIFANMPSSKWHIIPPSLVTSNITSVGLGFLRSKLASNILRLRSGVVTKKMEFQKTSRVHLMAEQLEQYLVDLRDTKLQQYLKSNTYGKLW